jgi:hypothetical protein
MIAPYLCKQQINQDGIPGLRTGVFFRLMLRQSLFGRGANTQLNQDGTIAQSAFFGQSPTQVIYFLKILEEHVFVIII